MYLSSIRMEATDMWEAYLTNTPLTTVLGGSGGNGGLSEGSFLS